MEPTESALIAKVRERSAPTEEWEQGIPEWALPSIDLWLRPFFAGSGATGRPFELEIERNLHLALGGRGRNAAKLNLMREIEADREVLLAVVDFALRNLEIGHHSPSNREEAPVRLDTYLTECGVKWRVRSLGDGKYSLEQRTDPSTDIALTRALEPADAAAERLSTAWNEAYGRAPNPDSAYKNAIKAAEDVAIPVVLPNDGEATLGKVIGALRSQPGNWVCTLDNPVGPRNNKRDAVLVVADQLGMLWQNEDDRHGTGGPPKPATQPEAELAVNLALWIVTLFRNGGLRRR